MKYNYRKSLSIALALGMTLSSTGQLIPAFAAEKTGDKAVQNEAGSQSSEAEFDISKDGVLTAYKGEAETVVIPDGVVEIGTNAFKSNKTIKKVMLPDTLETIGDGAFQYCSKFEKVVFAENSSLKTIGKDAFYSCSSLKKMTIPEGVTTIEDRAFASVGNLFTEINLPSTLEKLGNEKISDVFKSSKNLENINIAEGCENYYSYDGVVYQDKETVYCPLGKSGSVKIKNDTVKIGDNSFKDTKITGIDIPASVTTIGKGAFSDSSYQTVKLRYVNIPGTVKTIEENAFFNSMLETVILNEGTKTIGDNAFATCYNLRDGIVVPESVTTIGKYAFSDRGSDIKWICFKNPDAEIGKGVMDNYGGEKYTVYSDFSDEFKTTYGKVTHKPLSAFKEAESITFDKEDGENIPLDEQMEITAEINGEGAVSKAVTWVSDNPEMLSIDSTDSAKNSVKVTGHLKGETVLRAYLGDGTEAELEVEVGRGEEQNLFKVNEDGFITGYRGEPEEIIIPETVNDVDVVGIAEGAFEDSETLSSVVIPGYVKTIEEDAFKGCEVLSKVDIVSGVKEIGNEAFSGCKVLDEIVLPDSITTLGTNVFESCEHLEKAVLPASLEKIPDGTFSYCTSLDDVTLPEDTVEIGKAAFASCKSLSEIEFPETLKVIGERAFSNCVGFTELTIPEGVTTIRKFAFFDCTEMTELNLPSTAVTIGLTEAQENGDFGEDDEDIEDGEESKKNKLPDNPIRMLFEEKETLNSCCSMTALNFAEENPLYKSVNGLVYSKDGKSMLFAPRGSVEISVEEGTEEIGPYACFICFKLEKVHLPESLKVIGNTAFHYCEGITEMNLPEGLERVEHSGCFGVENWAYGRLPESLEYIGPYAFVECAADSIVIPEKITDISEYAFWGYEETLKHISFPDNLESIGNSAFAWAKNVKNLILPTTLKSIGDESLGTNYVETFITVPYGVKTVGAAFKGCKNLEGIYLPSTIESLDENLFSGCDKLKYIFSDSEESIAYSYAQEHDLQFVLYTENSELADGTVMVEDINRSIDEDAEDVEVTVNVEKVRNAENKVSDVINNPDVIECFDLETVISEDGSERNVDRFDEPAKLIVKIPERYRDKKDDIVLVNINGGKGRLVNVEFEEKYAVADITENGIYALAIPNGGDNDRPHFDDHDSNHGLPQKDHEGPVIGSMEEKPAEPVAPVEPVVPVAPVVPVVPETPSVTVTKTFNDVSEDSWYKPAVDYVTSSGLMNGVGDDGFAPDETLNRAMIAQVMYNMDGNNPVNSEVGFGDVDGSQWYSDAVNWAAETGIMNGYNSETFAPNDTVTREQMAVILYTYAKNSGMNVNVMSDLSQFNDNAQISAYAADAINWAAGSGIISGKGNGTLDPQGALTRAEFAQILMNFGNLK